MHDTVPHRLSGAVLVVVVVLGLGVVHRHHGERHGTRLLPGPETEDAGSGLFTAADDAVGVLFAPPSEQPHQVAAVVDDDVGVALERFA